MVCYVGRRRSSYGSKQLMTGLSWRSTSASRSPRRLQIRSHAVTPHTLGILREKCRRLFRGAMEVSLIKPDGNRECRQRPRPSGVSFCNASSAWQHGGREAWDVKRVGLWSSADIHVKSASSQWILGTWHMIDNVCFSMAAVSVRSISAHRPSRHRRQQWSHKQYS